MTSRLHGLDILRFLMALSVLLFHFAFRGAAGGDMPALDLPMWLVSASKYGYLGVSVFFMISGFVIAFSAEGRTPQEFAIARFARLYPTFILCMTLTFCVVLLGINPHFSASFGDYIANFAMSARAFGHPFMDGSYWSIVVEVLFYVWVFFLMVTGLFQSQKLTILLTWLFLSAVNQSFLHSGAFEKMFLTPFSGFFIAGIAIYELRKKQSFGMWMVLGLAMIDAVLASLTGKLAVEAELHTVLSSTVIIVVILAAPFLFYAFLAMKLPAWLINLATVIGGITYPLYLVHQNIGYVIFYWMGHGGLLSLALVMAGMVVVAFAIYMLFDRHMVRIVRRALTNLYASMKQNGRSVTSGSSPAPGRSEANAN